MTPQNLMLLPLSTLKLSIGCPILDDCLGGGIPCNSIIELVGDSGYGKTQLCLQLTVRAQLPPLHGGLEGSSVYIFTKFSFSFRRLQQLGNLYHASYPNLIRLEPLEDIYVHGVHDGQQLIHYQTTPANLKWRSEMFFNISGTLKGLANKFGLAVVVTNQVVDFIGPHDGVNGVRLGNLESLDTSGRRVSLALGLAWARCINSRVFLARHEPSIGINIRNAPSAIRKEGIVGVSRYFYCGLRNRNLSTFSKWCPLLAREFLLVKERVVEIAKAIDDEDGLIGALNAFHRHFPHSKSEDKPE
ncbi:hypothetical protein L3X38_008800 [Prunus dulcis]|uniref:RecA family profile 1 domain-containing protein n=1 Tax=Prunus dulcis TaxID=3755 RepID=A0AAD4ZX52_PRUDU|nr:hypothetical protein L3X38_008800 [Prunus dulcis]